MRFAGYPTMSKSRDYRYARIFSDFSTSYSSQIPVQLSKDSSIKDLKLLMKKWMGTPVNNVSVLYCLCHFSNAFFSKYA